MIYVIILFLQNWKKMRKIRYKTHPNFKNVLKHHQKDLSSSLNSIPSDLFTCIPNRNIFCLADIGRVSRNSVSGMGVKHGGCLCYQSVYISWSVAEYHCVALLTNVRIHRYVLVKKERKKGEKKKKREDRG